MIYQRVRGRIGGRVMSGLNGQHSGRAGMLSGVAAAIAGLTLNWASSPGNLIPPGFGLTRTGGGATYYDSTGTLQTAAADTARGTYMYNGSAWVFDGTMIEQAAENLALDSRFQSTPTYVSTSSCAITANQSAYIDGASVMAALIPAAVAGAAPFHYAFSTNNVGGALAVNANTEYCISVDVKRKAGTMGFRLYWATGGISSGVYADFNITTGVCSTVTAIGTGSSTGTPLIENVGGGIYRCSVSGKLDAASTGGYLVPCATKAYQDGSSFTPNGTDGFYICGWQLELGNAPTSRIVTTTASATRAADVVTAPTSGLLVNAQGFAAMKFRTIAEQAFGNFLSTFDGATGGVPLMNTAGALPMQLGIYDNTTLLGFGASTTFANPSVGTVNSVATTWGGTSCNGALNGVIGTAQTFDGSMDFAATLRIGAQASGGIPISMVLQSMRLGVQTVNNSRLANPFA